MCSSPANLVALERPLAPGLNTEGRAFFFPATTRVSDSGSRAGAWSCRAGVAHLKNRDRIGRWGMSRARGHSPLVCARAVFLPPPSLEADRGVSVQSETPAFLKFHRVLAIRVFGLVYPSNPRRADNGQDWRQIPILYFVVLDWHCRRSQGRLAAAGHPQQDRSRHVGNQTSRRSERRGVMAMPTADTGERCCGVAWTKYPVARERAAVRTSGRRNE